MSSSRRTNYNNCNSRNNNDRNIYNADSDESDDEPGKSNNNYRRRPQATIPSDLSKQLLKSYCHPAAQQQEEEDDLLGFGNRTPKATKPKRIPNDTADAVSELLRMFVVEAHSRAKLEAECDYEGEMNSDDENNDSEDDDDDNNKTKNKTTYVPIRADHITKIAAELTMDFS